MYVQDLISVLLIIVGIYKPGPKWLIDQYWPHTSIAGNATEIAMDIGKASEIFL